MWNSKAPLQLLMSMPKTLSKENVINLQKIIDVDKILNSRRLKRDLCGEYAPFCQNCDKSLPYPCAHAYVKMEQGEGLDFDIDESQLVTAEEEVAVTDEVAEEVADEPKKYIRIAHLKRIR